MAFSVIYEDNHLIIVNKASGILVQADYTGDPPLSDLVKEYLKQKYDKQGNVYCGVVHRLDRPVSGVVILAKTSKALERLNKMFQEHQIQKTYWAVVRDMPKNPEGKLVHWLIKNEERNVVKAFDYEVKAGKRSELDYRFLRKVGRFYLLEIKPLTGRPHQIRVQLASMDCPIIGDLRYGSPFPNPDASICLHAKKVEFVHPVQKVDLIFEANLPKEPTWDLC
ncbi:MAG: RluA family pseudouridine synthase [Bacteroidetes bacterium]|nr:MAG: RluA family pseudouridine synthase [Bacteroidota bacterium]